MKGESLCLRVQKRTGESTRRLLMRLSLLDVKQEISGDDDFINMPMLREPDSREWKLVRGVDPEAKTVTIESSLPEKTRSPRNIAEVLKDRVDPDLLPYAKHSFDVIGDIAVIEVPEELSSLKRPLAEAILEVHQGVRTVLCKSGAVDGKFRVRTYEHVIGEAKTVTTHKEHGCQYVLDVTKVYFSPRLATEHLRVASQVSADEVVVDMFAGIGPFSILIAKKRGAIVHAIDANPDAVEYMRKNCKLNKVEHLVDPILGDARDVVLRKLRGTASRVIMNLPTESLEFMDAACSALKLDGGIVHSYQFQSAPDPIDKAVEALRLKTESIGRKLQSTLGGRLVRSYAPHKWHVAVDAIVR